MIDDNVVIWKYIDFWLTKITSYKGRTEAEKDFEVESAVGARLREVLHEVCREASVFPHIAPDGEHGITAVWRATEFSLEISVWSDLSNTIIARGPGAPVHLYSFEDEGAKQLTEEHLKMLCDHVTTVNPKWRKFVPPMQ